MPAAPGLLHRQDKRHERLSDDRFAARPGEVTQPPVVIARGWRKVRENKELDASGVGDPARVASIGVSVPRLAQPGRKQRLGPAAAEVHDVDVLACDDG
jgi:hypothetical protein